MDGHGQRGASGPTLDYDHYVTGMLSWLTNRLSTGASASYRRLFGIGVMEWRVMAHLAIEPGATAARIGRLIGLDKAAVSRTVGGLAGAGLLRDAVGPETEAARGRRLELTQAGRALHDRVLAVAMRREARLLRGLTTAEADLLRGLLRRLLADLPTDAAEDA